MDYGKQVACTIEDYHHMLMTLLAKGQEISRGVDGLAGPFVLGLGENGQTGIVTKLYISYEKTPADPLPRSFGFVKWDFDMGLMNLGLTKRLAIPHLINMGL